MHVIFSPIYLMIQVSLFSQKCFKDNYFSYTADLELLWMPRSASNFSRTPVVFVEWCCFRQFTVFCESCSFTTFSALPLMFCFTKFCFVCFFFRGRRVRMPHIEFISADDRSSVHVLQPGLRRSPQLWRQPDTQSRWGLLQGDIFYNQYIIC